MVQLEEACVRLERGDLEGALVAALEAWRATHHPGLAMAVRRLSDEVVSARGPLPGKTRTARLALRIELAGHRDDAGALAMALAEGWPGTWQAALPLLEAVLPWDDDPRLEAMTAELLASSPWTSIASWPFFNRLLPVLRRLSDPAFEGALRRALSRPMPSWFRRELVPEIERALERLALPGPTLTPEAAQALERLSSRWAEATERQASQAKSAEELLAHIFDHPGDVTARAVFADWLTERGDPRGEFIALQLAPTPTAAQQARLSALLARHGRAWAGALDPFLDKKDRVFTRGFLSGGTLVAATQQALANALDWREWSLLTSLRVPALNATVVALLGRLRVDTLFLAGAHAAVAIDEAFDGGALPSLTHLGLEHPGARDADLPAAMASTLTRLTLPAHPTARAWFQRQVLPKLRALTLVESPWGFQDGWFECVTSNPRLLELTLTSRRSPFEDEGWTVRATRDADGHFRTLEGDLRLRGQARYRAVPTLEALLALFPAAELHTITLTSPRPVAFEAERRTRATQALARFTGARVQVPWSSEPPRPPKAELQPLKVRLVGEPFLGPSMQATWDDARALGLSFDSFSVGFGGVHRKLGKTPVASLDKWGARSDFLELYKDGGIDRLSISGSSRASRSDCGTTVSVPFDGDAAAFVERLVALLERRQIHEGTAGLEGTEVETEHLFHAPLSWISIFGPAQRELLPADALRAVFAEDTETRVIDTQRNRVVVLGDWRPEAVRAAWARHGEAFLRVLHTGFAAHVGFDPGRAFEAHLGSTAAALGFEATPAPAGSLDRVWSGSHGALLARVGTLLRSPRLVVALERLTAEGQRDTVHVVNQLFEGPGALRHLSGLPERIEAVARHWLEPKRSS
ncbi:MAG: TIGR02996 domain-containing protein [Myxococcaceae bacterium]|nr:TIGR02996 domain-containing protein [Myxococcaceae bacterium]